MNRISYLDGWSLLNWSHLLGAGSHWFPGANADLLDAEVSEAELLACLGDSPWAAQIPGILRRLRQRLGGQSTRRLMATD